MNDDHTNDFKKLHKSALTIATKMIASLNPEQAEWLEHAVKSGGKITMELGALPDCRKVELLLCEHEGQRTTIASIGVWIMLEADYKRLLRRRALEKFLYKRLWFTRRRAVKIAKFLV